MKYIVRYTTMKRLKGGFVENYNYKSFKTRKEVDEFIEKYLNHTINDIDICKLEEIK